MAPIEVGEMKKAGLRFRYMLMSHRPSTVDSAEQWDNFVTGMLLDLFAKEPATQGLKLESGDYWEMFDEYLIFQAGTTGHRIRFSQIVQHRLNVWEREASGPRKLYRLGRAEANAMLMFQRRRSVPMTDPDLKPARKLMIEELKLLLGRLSAIVRSHPRRLTMSVLENQCKAIVGGGGFHLLSKQLGNLLDYLTSPAAENFTGRLLAGERVSPTQLHDYWWGKRTSRDPEKYRQIIAGLGSR
jgi:hypothetical protein